MHVVYHNIVKEMFVIRIVFSKQGNMKYTSHLDMIRCFMRIFNRANIPISQTHGFNPHPYMVFSSPLSLGVYSKCEMLDIKTDDNVPAHQMKEKMQGTLPKGIEIIEIYEGGGAFNDIHFAEYILSIEIAFEEQLISFFNQDSIPYEKKTKKGTMKTINLKEEATLKKFVKDDKYINVFLTLPCGNLKNIGINLYIDAFATYMNKNDFLRKVERISFLDEHYEIFK